MTQLSHLFLIFVFIFCVSCKNTSHRPVETEEKDNILADTCADRAVIYTTITNFLRWYQLWETRPGPRNYPFKGGYPDSSNYWLDTLALKQYIAGLKKGGYLSDVFLDGIRQHYIAGGEYLKSNPQNDGPVMGFEGDDVMIGQDYIDVYDQLSNAMIRRCQQGNGKAIMKLTFGNFFRMRFHLTNQNNRWQIDSLGYEQ
jgi:hypothetical protein